MRDEEKSCKKKICGWMEHITARNNKDINSFLKFRKQGTTPDSLERKEKKQFVQKGENQMENQNNKGQKEKRMLAN